MEEQNAQNEYYCCDWVNSGLHFQPSRLGFCCYGYQEIGDHPTIIDDYNGECIDEFIIDDINEIKQKFKNGKIPKGCTNCALLKKADWDGLKESYFDHFMIGHSHKCNSKCIYCYTNNVSDEVKNKTYDAYSVLETLFEEGKVRVSNRACAVFLGGEPTIFPDFEDIMNLFLKNDFPNIVIHSSGIKYSKSVEKGLEKGCVKIVISPDSSTKETYEKIKRVPCFDKVWENIKEYAKHAKTPDLVKVKYILIPDINDSKSEIDKWFELVIDCGVKYIACDVEQNWYFSNDEKYKNKMYEMADYIKEKAEQYGLDLEYYTDAQRMLEERQKPTKYFSCDLIEHGLDFAPNAINFCCRTTTEGGGFKKLIDNYHGELLNLDDFFALKRMYRNKMKSGEGIPECKNCIYLEEKEYDNEDYISSINFNHGLNCNLRCVYCTFTHGEKIDEPEYDVYPVIKQLADAGKLKQGGYITIAGGEPTIYRNFEQLMRLFIDLKMKPIRILTNGVKYSPAIAEGLAKNQANIMISIDSGSPEMFKWIKGVNAFDKVWENIGKYLKDQLVPDLVKTKYIIIPEINDDKDEILKYFDMTERYGVCGVAFDIELTWFGENKDNIPQSLYDLVEFTVEEAKRRNLTYDPIDRVVTLLMDIKKKKDLDVSFRGHKL